MHTSPLTEAFKELLDPLIPVRGHALISLRRLIEQKDPETLEMQDILVQIFHENLDHPDSYIYLAAIQGLAALAERLPQKVIGTAITISSLSLGQNRIIGNLWLTS